MGGRPDSCDATEGERRAPTGQEDRSEGTLGQVELSEGVLLPAPVGEEGGPVVANAWSSESLPDDAEGE